MLAVFEVPGLHVWQVCYEQNCFCSIHSTYSCPLRVGYWIYLCVLVRLIISNVFLKACPCGSAKTFYLVFGLRMQVGCPQMFDAQMDSDCRKEFWFQFESVVLRDSVELPWKTTHLAINTVAALIYVTEPADIALVIILLQPIKGTLRQLLDFDLGNLNNGPTLSNSEMYRFPGAENWPHCISLQAPACRSAPYW